VTVLPGPSAVSTALVLSGLPADRFAFVGFLARTKSKLVEQIAVFDGTGAAVVAFESPRRVSSSVTAIGERWPERRMAVCRELSKLHEEAVRGTAADVLEHLSDPVRGEIVVVLEAAVGTGGTASGGRGGGLVGPDVEGAVHQTLEELIESGIGVKKAAGIVAALTGLPRRTLYELGSALKEGRH
jgi:16S rRNA (cytidine1402-2'-O)-methyltransferase